MGRKLSWSKGKELELEGASKVSWSQVNKPELDLSKKKSQLIQGKKARFNMSREKSADPR
jgi:hypothetical protein